MTRIQRALQLEREAFLNSPDMNLREVPDEMKEQVRFEAYFKEQVEERYRAQADYIIELAKDTMTRAPMPHKKQ